MAHARRKIHDLHVRKATVTTTEALRRIGERYAIEDQIRGRLPDHRQQYGKRKRGLCSTTSRPGYGGGERAATMYFLIVSARLNGIDPQAYLRHVLTHIADYPVNRVENFLPWNLADKLSAFIV